MPPSSGSSKQARNKQGILLSAHSSPALLLVSFTLWPCTCRQFVPSKCQENFYQTIWHHIPGDSTLHGSYKYIIRLQIQTVRTQMTCKNTYCSVNVHMQLTSTLLVTIITISVLDKKEMVLVNKNEMNRN
jgi:hypothetical protein